MADRSVNITLSNTTPQTLSLTDESLAWGVWTTNMLPASSVGGGSPSLPNDAVFQSESQGFCTGTQGTVTYTFPDGATTVTLNWDNPYWGSNAYSASMAGPQAAGYSCTTSGGNGDNSAITYTLSAMSQEVEK